ncbi:MAG: potassium channel family protein [Gammaproteobacteria bacterium]
MNGKPIETPAANADVRQNTSDGTKIDKHLLPSRNRIAGIYGFALLLALVLFYFHVLVIFDVIGEMLRYKPWLLEKIGPKHTGKLFLLGCFFALLSAHVTQAVVWGIFLRRTQLLPSITEGVYFAAASMTTLGYGDILLKYPWRHLSTLIAITGVLMFGCSTAFLFVTLQDVWQHIQEIPAAR